MSTMRPAPAALGGLPVLALIVALLLPMEPATQRWFAMHREMDNQQTGHKTVLRFEKVEAGVDAPDEMFTTRYVERE